MSRSEQRSLGFSLLEVMVAIALLSLSFTMLTLVQARATRMAIQSRHISVATQLARLQLTICKSKVLEIITSVSDFNEEGDFEALGYPDYKWECHAPKFNMKPPAPSQVADTAKGASTQNAKNNLASAGSVSAPIISMITDSLGDSVREIVLIIRWQDGNIGDEMRVVTHVIDLNAMAGLARMLQQGLKNFDQATPTKDSDRNEDGAQVKDPNQRGTGRPGGGL